MEGHLRCLSILVALGTVAAPTGSQGVVQEEATGVRDVLTSYRCCEFSFGVRLGQRHTILGPSPVLDHKRGSHGP